MNVIFPISADILSVQLILCIPTLYSSCAIKTVNNKVGQMEMAQ